MPSRAACRYSSIRWADGTAPAAIAKSSVSRATDLLRELRTVFVRRVAIDRVDVIDAAALRRVLDHDGGSLDPEIRRTPAGRRAAPGKVGLREVGANLRHARL